MPRGERAGSESRRTVIGIQAVAEALRVHGPAVLGLWAEPTHRRVEALMRRASELGVEVHRATAGDLDRAARGARHQGVVAQLAPLVLRGLDEVDLTTDCPLVILDGVTDPQNFGAVIRAAVALGAGTVLWAEHGAAPLTTATFRASAGAVEHARLFRVASLHEAVAELGRRGAQTVLLEGSAPTALQELPLVGPTAIVVGSEERGARRNVRRACSASAHIAMSGRIGSLNASVAAAIALYEVARQAAGPHGAAVEGPSTTQAPSR